MTAPGPRALVGLLGVWNVVVNQLLPERHYIRANLAAASALYAAARLSGRSATTLGTGIASARRGLRWGLGGAAVSTIGTVAASRIHSTRGFFSDDRVRVDDVPYQTLVRIPFGTVVLEEIAFRSVLPAVLGQSGRGKGALNAAALFGLWHILPTLNTLDINGVADRKKRARAVAGGVVATAAAGLAFEGLRRGSGSVLAPMLTHWAANAVAYAVAARSMARPAGAVTRQADAPE